MIGRWQSTSVQSRHSISTSFKRNTIYQLILTTHMHQLKFYFIDSPHSLIHLSTCSLSVSNALLLSPRTNQMRYICSLLICGWRMLRNDYIISPRLGSSWEGLDSCLTSRPLMNLSKGTHLHCISQCPLLLNVKLFPSVYLLPLVIMANY